MMGLGSAAFVIALVHKAVILTESPATTLAQLVHVSNLPVAYQTAQFAANMM
jgi:hypothetical protein